MNPKRKNFNFIKPAIIIISFVLAASLITLCGIFSFCFLKYKTGIKMLEEGNYGGAVEIFSEFSDVPSSEEYLMEAYYGMGSSFFDEGRYQEAIQYFRACGEQNDSTEKIALAEKYLSGIKALENKEFQSTADIFSALNENGSVYGSRERLHEAYYELADELYSDGSYLAISMRRNILKRQKAAAIAQRE